MLQTPVGEVSTILDFVPIEEYRDTIFYKEFAVPQGYCDSIQAALEKSATSYATANVILDEERSPASEQARRRMKLLAPHFRRAVQIGKVIDLKEVKAAALADALDGIAAGMWLLDANARIVHANAAGQTMLAEKAAVHTANGKLMLLDLAGDRALQEMLGNLGAGDAAIGDKGISMPLRGRDDKEYVAQILPLTSGARQKAGAAHSAAAALFIRARHALAAASAGDDRRPLSADAGGVARADDDHRHRRRAGGRPRARRLAKDREDASETRVREDRRAGRPTW